jgi:hypothetical protein
MQQCVSTMDHCVLTMQRCIMTSHHCLLATTPRWLTAYPNSCLHPRNPCKHPIACCVSTNFHCNCPNFTQHWSNFHEKYPVANPGRRAPDLQSLVSNIQGCEITILVRVNTVFSSNCKCKAAESMKIRPISICSEVITVNNDQIATCHNFPSYQVKHYTLNV